MFCSHTRTSEVFGNRLAGLDAVLQVAQILSDSLHVDCVRYMQSVNVFTQFNHLHKHTFNQLIYIYI